MSEPNISFVPGDWYNLPDFYDAIFDQDTSKEADFLESIWREFGGGRKTLRILEPACGSGRLVVELSKRGHTVEGFDSNPRMIEAAREKLVTEHLRALLLPGRMEAMPAKGRYDLVHCLLSTFKYIRTEREATAHLQQAAQRLARGGLYVLGIHLTDYGRKRNETEKWTASTGRFDITCETTTFPPDGRRRAERLRNRLRVRFKAGEGQGRPPPQQIETRWVCRTYDATQLRKLLARVPGLECIACYDFTYDLDSPRELDDSQDDIVLILKKSGHSATVSR